MAPGSPVVNRNLDTGAVEFLVVAMAHRDVLHVENNQRGFCGLLALWLVDYHLWLDILILLGLFLFLGRRLVDFSLFGDIIRKIDHLRKLLWREVSSPKLFQRFKNSVSISLQHHLLLSNANVAILKAEHAVHDDVFNLLILQHEVKTPRAIANLCHRLKHFDLDDARIYHFDDVRIDQKRIFVTILDVANEFTRLRLIVHVYLHVDS